MNGKEKEKVNVNGWKGKEKVDGWKGEGEGEVVWLFVCNGTELLTYLGKSGLFLLLLFTVRGVC